MDKKWTCGTLGLLLCLGWGERERKGKRERWWGVGKGELATISPLDHLTIFFFFAMNSPADNLMSNFQQLWKPNCWKLKQCLLSPPLFFLLAWLHTPGKRPQEPNNLKQDWAGGLAGRRCITGDAHLCKLPRLQHLLLSYRQSVFYSSHDGSEGTVLL